MIYELRIYTCRPGTMGHVLEMWENEGRAMIDPYLHMVGQWTSETGTVNQIYTLWSFRDMAHRQEARAQLMRHPGFPEYLARCREAYVEQQSILLISTPISPLQ